ncbi:MAG: right-handed parallel beta-helix repeat-containing protein [Bacteroidota bacterium]
MKTKFLLATLVLSLCFLSSIQAQDCDCDHVIDPTTPFVKGENFDIQPGDRICLMAGEYDYLHILNFHGEPGNPITFVNCGGKVTVGQFRHHFGFVMENCQYFRLTGTGDENINYGILVDGTTNRASGMSISTFSTDFEVDHVEFANTGGAGFHMVMRPSCDPATHRANFTQRNIFIHDNYAHDNGAEGFYMGHSFYNGQDIQCDGQTVTVFPMLIDNIRFYNNITERTGQDGFQVSTAESGAEIYNNVVRDYGLNEIPAQAAGIVVGGGTSGRIYNNWIENGFAGGIHVFGIGDVTIFNNVIKDAGESGIFIGDKTTLPGRPFQVINNTIIEPAQKGIDMNSDISSDNVIYNNIIINPGALSDFITNPLRAYINFKNQAVDADTTKNHFNSAIANVAFENANSKIFHLLENSPAANNGVDVSDYGITFDFNFFPRGQSGSFSAGAFEFGTERTGIVTSIEDDIIESNSVLDLRIFPNPVRSNGTLKAEITLKQNQNISLELVDIQGRLVSKIIENEFLSQGQHSFEIPLKDHLDTSGATGVYLLSIETGDDRIVRQVNIFR